MAATTTNESSERPDCLGGTVRLAVPPVRLLRPTVYLPRAEQVFDEVRQQLSAALPDARVDHVGSSAIPGAISKGDIDICVAVRADRFEAGLQVLAGLGYHEAENTLRTPQLCMLKSRRCDIDLALQLIEAGSRFEFFLRFRDALRAAPSLVTEYNELKTAHGPQGAPAYREAKDGFIRRVLERCV
jgi:GrpB-like predicted nucleotidyltransferase (UPF0157 family)